MQTLYLDVETSKRPENNNLKQVRLVQLGMLTEGGHDSFIIDHNEQSGFEHLPELQRFFREYDGTIVAHKADYEYGVLTNHGFTFPKAKWRCTLLGLKNYNENETRVDLKTWATYLGYPPYWLEFKDALDAEGAEGFPIPKLVEYNGYDLYATRDLDAWVTPKIQQTSIYDLECEIVPLVAQMQNHGIRVEPEAVNAKIGECEKKIVAIERRFRNEFQGVNLNSPAQVAKLLYDTLGLNPGGSRSTAEPVLKKLHHPVPKLILEYRGLQKLVGSYYQAILDLRDPVTDVVRGDFFIRGAESGRFSCKHPPLQTLPEDFRGVFLPQFGRFVWLDLSQIEFRIAADLAGEDDLIAGIRAGFDVHAAAAKVMFGKTDDAHRKLAKTCNFAILYGAGVGKVMEQTGFSYHKAKELLADFARNFPKIMAWKQGIERQVQRGDVIVSPFGRRRHLATIPRSDGQLFGLMREAVNFVPQSMGHDILMTCWVELDKRLRAVGAEFAYANEVHDELVLDVSMLSLDKVQQVCKDVLAVASTLVYERFGYRFTVPITGEVKTGERWH